MVSVEVSPKLTVVSLELFCPKMMIILSHDERN